MNQPQVSEPIMVDGLVDRVRVLREEGWRLVQVGGTGLGERLEVNYSFDREGHFLNLRLELPADDARIPSISSVYWCAFIYENELHDLYRVQVDGMALDFGGKFYQMRVKFPFARMPAAPNPAGGQGVPPEP
jgi:ech hydrogenase subunit D